MYFHNVAWKSSNLLSSSIFRQARGGGQGGGLRQRRGGQRADRRGRLAHPDLDHLDGGRDGLHRAAGRHLARTGVRAGRRGRHHHGERHQVQAGGAGSEGD